MKKFVLVAMATVFSASSSFAATYAYTCYPAKTNSGFESIIKVTVNSKRATIKDDENGIDSVAKRNTDYHPRKANANMLMYDGFDSGESYQTEMLVDRSLLTGGLPLKRGGNGGVVKVRARGEGYFSGSFLCVDE